MKLVIGELQYYNWNTVRAFGTILRENDLATDSVDIWVQVDPYQQQSLRVQVENNVRDFYNQQFSAIHGVATNNDIQFLC